MPDHSAQPHILEETLPQEEAAQVSASRMRFIAADLAARPHRIHFSQAFPRELIIGRGAQCNLVIREPSVSALHARIFVDKEQLYVEDLSSTNGTRLNGERLTQPKPIQEGDDLLLGLADLHIVTLR